MFVGAQRRQSSPQLVGMDEVEYGLQLLETSVNSSFEL